MSNIENWLKEKIEYYRGLKNPTREQSTLLNLYGIEDKSAVEKKLFQALIKSEKLAWDADLAKTHVRKMVKQQENLNGAVLRKERNTRLINIGLAAMEAGVVDSKTAEFRDGWSIERLRQVLASAPLSA
jgi:hypothetical protein